MLTEDGNAQSDRSKKIYSFYISSVILSFLITCFPFFVP